MYVSLIYLVISKARVRFEIMRRYDIAAAEAGYLMQIEIKLFVIPIHRTNKNSEMNQSWPS